MPRARLVFDGDGVYTEKEARIHKLTQETETKIDNIPGIVDDVNSDSTTDALSAHMGKVLQNQINNLAGVGTFLSNWDCTTGLPESNPQVDPYTYKPGNYYIVANVADSGGTNYKPHGSEYHQGVASTTVETGSISMNDWYIYDGSQWLIQPAGNRTIVIDDALSPSSTNAVENRAVYSALTQKQNNILDLATIREGATAGSTAIQPGDNISELTNNAGYQTAGDVAAAIAEVSANINTKTFPLSGTGSSAEVLAEAQDIVDFFLSGGIPLINWGDCIWVLISNKPRETPKSLWFKRNVPQFDTFGGSTTALLTDELKIEYYGTTASDVLHFNGNYYTKFLNTDTDYLIPYTPTYDGSPATKKYVDDTVESATEGSKYVGPTSPSNPTEGMLWYDTTNDILKVYDGTNWNAVSDDNTRTFALSSASDLTNAQAAYDWYKAGKFPIITYGGNTYFLKELSGISLRFSRGLPIARTGVWSGGVDLCESFLDLDRENNQSDVIVGVSESLRTTIDNASFLSTSGTNNAYTPSSNYDPATKKYVDDTVSTAVDESIHSGSTAPSSPTAGTLWYDTTNNVLKVYNGTSWATLQELLVNGVSIKTVNNHDLLGSGNIDIVGVEEIQFVTQDEYDALPSSKTSDGKAYFIYSGHGAAIVSDEAFSSSWDGITTQAPSKNAVYDKISTMDTAVSNKQDTLISGTNIKTINNTSLLGSGNIDLSSIVVSGCTFGSLANACTALGTQHIKTLSSYQQEYSEAYIVKGLGWVNTSTYSSRGAYVYVAINGVIINAQTSSSSSGTGSTIARDMITVSKGDTVQVYCSGYAGSVSAQIYDYYDDTELITSPGIYYSSSQQLVSMSADGVNWFSIADRDLGGSPDSRGSLYYWGNSGTENWEEEISSKPGYRCLTYEDRSTIRTIFIALYGNTYDFRPLIHMTTTASQYSDTSDNTYYWLSKAGINGVAYTCNLPTYSTSLPEYGNTGSDAYISGVTGYPSPMAHPVRPVKNVPVQPTLAWDVSYQPSS